MVGWDVVWDSCEVWWDDVVGVRCSGLMGVEAALWCVAC